MPVARWFGWAALVAAAVLLAASGPAAAAGAAGAVHVKRGVASSAYLRSDPGRLARIGATWSYDWSADPPAGRSGPAWVPMVWGAGSVTASVLASLRAQRRSGRARYLLGFNEPDASAQADLTPAQAAALWPQLEQTGLRLGSPAPAVPGDGWLARFMALAARRHLRVDFIALHFYPDFTDPGSVAALRAQLQAIHARYRRPLWITEIGSMDILRWGEPMLRAPTEARAVSFVRRLFSMLDHLSFVARYAWFTDACWNDLACHTSSLYDGRGRLTAVGRAFETSG
jgi:hypothetical protein